MLPVHSQYEVAETFEFQGAITLKLLLSDDQTDGSIAMFEDLVQPGIGPG